MNKRHHISVLLVITILASSCGNLHPRNEFKNNHNLIGIWSFGSIQYKNEELLGWVYVNTLEFYDNDTVRLSEYPNSSFPKYGVYKMRFSKGVINEVEIRTEDTLYAGVYDIIWREYYTTPRARDSILSSVVLQSDKTLIWLNSRLTGWRK